MKSTTVKEAQHTSQLSEVSEAVLLRHLSSFSNNDLDVLMSDYTEQSVLITHDNTYSGISQIQSFFMELMTHFPKRGSSFSLDKLEIDGELVFIVWHAVTPSLEVSLGTDTFVIKQGKIYRQTFAGQMRFLN